MKTEKESVIRSNIVKKNIIASFLIKVGNIAVGLILISMTINYISSEKYGIWITIISMITWLDFFDIGLGHGLRNKLVECIAQLDYEKARIYISTTYAFLIIIVTILAAVFFSINLFLNWAKIMNAPPEMAQELNTLAKIVFGCYFVRFVLKLILTVLLALQQTAKSSFIDFLGNILALIGIFLLIHNHIKPSLVYLGFIFSIIPLATLFFTTIIVFCFSAKTLAPAWRYIDFSYWHSLMNLGAKFFIIQIAAITIYQSSNFIILQLFGSEQVTSYNIATRYFGVLSMVFSIILSPYWSAITDAYFKNDFIWIKSVIKRLRLYLVLFIIAALVMLGVADKVYDLWVGKSVQIPMLLSASIALSVVITMWNSVLVNFLNGVGKVQLQLILGITSAVFFIPLALMYSTYFGIAGVVIASITVSIICIIIYPIQYSKIITNNAVGIWNK